MAGMAGFEPADDGVKVRCLTPWLHPKIGFAARINQLQGSVEKIVGTLQFFGVDDRDRTDDLQGHNLAL